jgi:hypothetical protein
VLPLQIAMKHPTRTVSTNAFVLNPMNFLQTGMTPR